MKKTLLEEVRSEIGEELFSTLLDDEARYAFLLRGTDLGTRKRPCETAEEAESLMKMIDAALADPEEAERARRRAIDVLWEEVGKERMSALVHYLNRVSSCEDPSSIELACFRRDGNSKWPRSGRKPKADGRKLLPQ